MMRQARKHLAVDGDTLPVASVLFFEIHHVAALMSDAPITARNGSVCGTVRGYMRLANNPAIGPY